MIQREGVVHNVKVLVGVGILGLLSACALAAQTPGPLPQPAQTPAPVVQQRGQLPPTRVPPGPAASAPTPHTTKSAVPAAATIEVPTGTHLPLVLHNGISTRSARVGDSVYLETLFPIIENNRVVIPAGSYVSGEITEAKRPGRVKGRGEIGIKLNELILPNGYAVSFNASPSNAGTGGGETVDNEGRVKGDSDKASDAATMIKLTSVGAGIGGLAGRSGEAAGIGAGIGAAAGLATVLLTRGPDAELPRGSTLDAVLNHPLFLDASKVNFSSPGQASTLPGPPNREPRRSRVPF